MLPLVLDHYYLVCQRNRFMQQMRNCSRQRCCCSRDCELQLYPSSNQDKGRDIFFTTEMLTLKTPALNIDKCNGVTVWLSQEACKDPVTEIYTSKCSSINISIPSSDGEDRVRR